MCSSESGSHIDFSCLRDCEAVGFFISLPHREAGAPKRPPGLLSSPAPPRVTATFCCYQYMHRPRRGNQTPMQQEQKECSSSRPTTKTSITHVIASANRCWNRADWLSAANSELCLSHKTRVLKFVAMHGMFWSPPCLESQVNQHAIHAVLPPERVSVTGSTDTETTPRAPKSSPGFTKHRPTGLVSTHSGTQQQPAGSSALDTFVTAMIGLLQHVRESAHNGSHNAGTIHRHSFQLHTLCRNTTSTIQAYYAATGVSPECRSSASVDGPRPRKDVNTVRGSMPPPSASTVSRNRLPISATCFSSCSPASSNAPKASADSTSAHL
jgi:hypothetical protein